MTQTGSLNLFSSKEQEFELRAQMLKRLSFAIFCSPPDQYQRNMPEIQGQWGQVLPLEMLHVWISLYQGYFCSFCRFDVAIMCAFTMLSRHSVGPIKENSSHATPQGMLIHSHLSSLSYCGLILA